MEAQLTSGIVRIHRTPTVVAGTGFIVSVTHAGQTEFLILTCSHVVLEEAAQRRGAAPPKHVDVSFVDGSHVEAMLLPAGWRGMSDTDIAVLRLTGKLPPGAKPLLLGSSLNVRGHRFTTFGFPPGHWDTGLFGYGTLGDARPDGLTQLTGASEVTVGFSGAPLFDDHTRRVVGMVRSILAADTYGKLVQTAFMTPSQLLLGAWPALKVRDLPPYRGLTSFGEEDVALFFGRGELIKVILRSLQRDPHFLAIIGASGTGKSSLLNAGVVPALRRGDLFSGERCQIFTLRPGSNPLGELTGALGGAGQELMTAVQNRIRSLDEEDRIVIVIDQFEEALTAPSTTERQAFFAQFITLLNAPLPNPLTVIVVMRSDFQDRLSAQSPEFMEWLNNRQVYVPIALKPDDLRLMIVGPAEHVGMSFEPSLVELILDDVIETSRERTEGDAGRAAMLPLLQFTLHQLWERRQGTLLTQEAYRNIGRVSGALTRWADRQYQRFSLADRAVVRRILTDLIYIGDPDRLIPDTHRLRQRNELYREGEDCERVDQVIEQLTRARILVVGKAEQLEQATVEIIHDALLLEWDQLRDWLREDEAFLRWRQELEPRANRWAQSSDQTRLRANDLLLTSREECREAAQYLRERADDLSSLERSYLQASILQERRRRRVAFGAGLFGVATATFMLAIIIFLQQQSTQEQQRAQAGTLAAQALSLSRQRPELLPQSALLAIEAHRRSPSAETDQAVRATMGLLPQLYDSGTVAATSPRGTYLATVTGGTIVLRQGIDGSLWKTFTYDGELFDLVFDPEERYLITAIRDATDNGWDALVWDLTSQRVVSQLHHDEAITSQPFQLFYEQPRLSIQKGLLFALDGSHLVTVSGSAGINAGFVLRQWNLSTGVLEWTQSFSERPQAVGISDNGNHVWATSTTLPYGTGGIDPNAFSDILRMIDAQSGELLNTVNLPSMSLGLGMANGQLRVLARDVTGAKLEILNPIDGSTTGTLPINEQFVGYEATPDLRQAIIYLNDQRTIALWDIAAQKEVGRIQGEQAIIFSQLSPSGRYLAIRDANNQIEVWNLATRRSVGRMSFDKRIWWITFSPDERLLLITLQDENQAQVRDIATGQEVQRIIHPLRTERVYTLLPTVEARFDSTGRWIISDDGAEAHIWQATAGSAEAVFRANIHYRQAFFNHTGKHLALVQANDVRVLDVVGGFDQADNVWREELVTLLDSNDAYTAYVVGDHKVELWPKGVEIRQVLATIEEAHTITAVALDPENQFFLTGNADGQLSLYSIPDGKRLEILKHDHPIKQILLSTAGKQAAVLGSTSATLWDLVQRTQTTQITSQSPLVGFALSGSGNLVATRDSDGIITVYSTRDQSVVQKLKLESTGTAIDLNDDGSILAVSDGSDVILYNTADREAIFHLVHPARVTALKLTPLNQLASFSDDGQVWLWELEYGRPLLQYTVSPSVEQMAFGVDRLLVTRTADGGAVTIFHSAQKIERISPEGGVAAFALSPNGQMLAIGSYDGSASIWGVDDQHQRLRLSHAGKPELPVPVVKLLAFSGDGKYLATASSDHSLRMWDLVAGTEISRVDLEDIRFIALSPDGRHVLSVASFENAPIVWDAHTGERVAQLAEMNFVGALAMSPDGATVAVSGSFAPGVNVVQIWDTTNWSLRWEKTVENMVAALVYSPDSQWLATVGDHMNANDRIDNRTRAYIYHIKNKRDAIVLEHDAIVQRLVFSPTGRELLTWSIDNTLRIWDVATKKIRVHMPQQSAALFAFSPDARYLAVAQNHMFDGGFQEAKITILFWQPDDIVRSACERVAITLTQEEWQQYLPAEPYRETCSADASS